MLTIINDKLFGPLLPVFLGISAIFMLVKLRFKPLNRPKSAIKCLFSDSKNEAFRSMCLSLAGTLGVGNIAGVASAISVGGSGAIFWMWIFAILASVLKYSEIVLGASFGKHGSGGPYNYIRFGLNMPILGVIFSILVIISSVGVGNIVQCSAAAESLLICFEVPKITTALAFAIINLILIYKGKDVITNVVALVIPVLSIGYIIISLAIIIKNGSQLPSVLRNIINDAFSFGPIFGGGVGLTVSSAIRYGASRGILSNEAGCGTAPYAHSASKKFAEQGIWGMFEVIIDTVILCSLTAFVVLLSPANCADSANGMAIALGSYGVFGSYVRSFIGISTAVYALASIVCWSYYGVCALETITKNKRSRILYLIIYSIAGILGGIFSPSLVWEISDISVALMTICNTICVMLLWRNVKHETDKCF